MIIETARRWRIEEHFLLVYLLLLICHGFWTFIPSAKKEYAIMMSKSSHDNLNNDIVTYWKWLLTLWWSNGCYRSNKLRFKILKLVVLSGSGAVDMVWIQIYEIRVLLSDDKSNSFLLPTLKLVHTSFTFNIQISE